MVKTRARSELPIGHSDGPFSPAPLLPIRLIVLACEREATWGLIYEKAITQALSKNSRQHCAGG